MGETERGGESAVFVCWHCGKKRSVLIPRQPQFAFELVGWAQDVGMKGFFDQRYCRALIFCDGQCARNEMTKGGFFRQRPRGPAKIAPGSSQSGQGG